MARRSLTLLLAVGLLAAAGCVGGPPPPPPPPPATEVCGLSFGSAGQYTTSFQDLGRGGTGWVNADGFVPIALPDGTTAWWMSDTNTGSVNPDNSVSSSGFRHNTIVQQGVPNSSCLRPTFGNPDVLNGSGGAWYWPGAAVIQGDQMLVFSHKVRSTGSGPFDFEVIGSSVTRYSVPSLQLMSGPTDIPRKNAPNGGSAIPWGTRAVNGSNGRVYLYGSTKFINPFAGPVGEAWVARAQFGSPTQLQYFTNPTIPPLNPDDAWSSDFTQAKPMTFKEGLLDKSAPLAQLSVVPYGSGYLAGAFAADVFQDENGQSFVWAWTADKPEGPWHRVQNLDGSPKIVATFQKHSPDQVAYDAHIEPLTGPGRTVVYSVNDPNRGLQDFRLYGGEFKAPNAGSLPPPP